MKLLKKGDRNEDVRILQEKLKSSGFNVNKIDAIFGNGTELAVRGLQKKENLTVDGVVGNQTWRKLDEYLTKKNNRIEFKVLRKSSRGLLVKKLQERLDQLGFSISAKTEYFGSLTDNAVRRFQHQHNLLADGVVGKNTWLALGFQDKKVIADKAQASISTLIKSVGESIIIAAHSANKLSKIDLNAKPVSQLNISEKGLLFLYTREAWQGRSNVLHWPKGSSGVTLGPGYDMKTRSEAIIKQDMVKIGLPVKTAEKIAKASGLKGEAAKLFCKNNIRLVTLTNKKEYELMRMIVPYYERLARNKIKIDLTQHEFDALVSFAYNLGQVWSSIANHINAGRVSAAMNRMKDANKSGGIVNEGLIKRRALEIAVYTLADYGKLRVI